LLSATQAVAYAKSLKAAELGDISKLLLYGAAAGGFVLYNSNRNAIQIVGCNGTGIRASVSLTESAPRGIAAATLPDARSRMKVIAFVVAARGLYSASADRSAEILEGVPQEVLRLASPFAR
jgi:hypothetical protein